MTFAEGAKKLNMGYVKMIVKVIKLKKYELPNQMNVSVDLVSLTSNSIFLIIISIDDLLNEVKCASDWCKNFCTALSAR